MAIADRVGHESIDITYKYAHLFPSKQKEMAQRLDIERTEGRLEMEKVLDRKGRWRNKVVAFRVSPEEDELLETKVRLSGLTKQDYIISRLLEKEITVVGNPRVYKALRNQMESIYEELQRIAAGETVDDELLETLQLVAITLNEMKEDI